MAVSKARHTRLRSYIANTALMLASIVMALVIAEAILRVPSLFQAPGVNQHEACCQHDELLGWKHVPNPQR